MSEYTYKPETTQSQRSELLQEIRSEPSDYGLGILQAVLRDLDRAERVILAYRAFLHKEGFGS